MVNTEETRTMAILLSLCLGLNIAISGCVEDSMTTSISGVEEKKVWHESFDITWGTEMWHICEDAIGICLLRGGPPDPLKFYYKNASINELNGVATWGESDEELPSIMERELWFSCSGKGDEDCSNMTDTVVIRGSSPLEFGLNVSLPPTAGIELRVHVEENRVGPLWTRSDTDPLIHIEGMAVLSSIE